MKYLHAVDSDRLPSAHDDPWETARDGEVWWWDGKRLVPASSDEVAMLREIDALRRLGAWEGNAQLMPAQSCGKTWQQRLSAGWARVAGWALLPRGRGPDVAAPIRGDMTRTYG
jgi:hypothetical protein